MHSHTASVTWSRAAQAFLDNRYSRRHEIEFDGGVLLAGSSSPQVVREPFSDPRAVDPEEMFVASLSSCHMLWFLSLAASRGFCVDHYRDEAFGVMEKNVSGRLFMSTVTLRPRVAFSGDRLPTRHDMEDLHHEAHEACFIANSVRTQVICEPQFDIRR